MLSTLIKFYFGLIHYQPNQPKRCENLQKILKCCLFNYKNKIQKSYDLFLIELYEKMEKDTIFIPIKNNIEKPAEYRKKQQRKLTMDQKVQKHLENTCSIVGKLNNSDLKMMRNVLENQKYKGRER